MNSPVSPVRAGDFPACIDFLKPREFRAISLASHLSKDGQPCFPGAQAAFVRLAGEHVPGQTDGLVLLTANGILLHCLREDCAPDPYLGGIREFLAGKNVRCVIGTGTDTRTLETCIGKRTARSVDYQLMTCMTIPAERPLILEGAKIVSCGPEDAAGLYPLQEGYEREEVIPPGDPFVPDLCLGGLRASLAKQYIWGIRAEGRWIAKAGTNARGLAWDQLGGVYTAPEYRGRGIASALVAYAASERIRAGRKTALFVKLDNVPARRAYDRAGFSPAVPYRISYY